MISGVILCTALDPTSTFCARAIARSKADGSRAALESVRSPRRQGLPQSRAESRATGPELAARVFAVGVLPDIGDRYRVRAPGTRKTALAATSMKFGLSFLTFVEVGLDLAIPFSRLVAISDRSGQSGPTEHNRVPSVVDDAGREHEVFCSRLVGTGSPRRYSLRCRDPLLRGYSS